MPDSALKKKYIITLTDERDENQYILNGLFLLLADEAGGWTELDTRCKLGRIKLRGEKAPKSENAVIEKLRWKNAAIVKSGHPSEIPNCLTYTQLINELVAAKKIPGEPDSSFEPNDEEGPSVEHPAPQMQAAFDQSAAEALENLGGGYDTEHMNEEEGNDNSEEVHALKEQMGIIADRNAHLENLVATGQTEQSNTIIRSMKGYVDNAMKSLSTSLEGTIKREIRNAVGNQSNESLQLVHEKLNSIDGTITDVESKVNNIDGTLNDVDSGVRRVLSGQENDKVSLELLVQNSKVIRSKVATSNNNSTPKSTVFNDSGYGDGNSPIVSKPPPPKKCDYCQRVGHFWMNCYVRPKDYRCYRCHAPNHKDTTCPTLNEHCDICTALGHSSTFHSISDPQVRVNILLKFGGDCFKTWEVKPTAAATRKNSWPAPNSSKKQKY